MKRGVRERNMLFKHLWRLLRNLEWRRYRTNLFYFGDICYNQYIVMIRNPLWHRLGIYNLMAKQKLKKGKKG
jgi:hypothetical protein